LEGAEPLAAVLDAFEHGSDRRRVLAPRLAARHSVLRVSAGDPGAGERPRPLAQNLKRGGHFPNHDAAPKLIWLALRNITASSGKPANSWHPPS